MQFKKRFNTLPTLLFYISIGLMACSWCLQALGGSKGYDVVGMALIAHITIVGIGLAFPVWANVTFVLSCIYYLENTEKTNKKAKLLSFITIFMMMIGCLIALTTDGIAWGAIIWLFSGIVLCIAISLRQKILNVTIAVVLLSLLFISTFFLNFLSLSSKKYVTSNMWEHARGTLFVGLKYFNNQEKIEIPSLNYVKTNDQDRIDIGDQRHHQQYDLSALNGKLIELDSNKVIYSADFVVKGICPMQTGQNLAIQLPLMYLQHGFKWKLYAFGNINNGQFAVGVSSREKADYIYTIKALREEEAQLTIKNAASQHILYTQKLVPFYDAQNKQCKYEPSVYKKELNSQFIQTDGVSNNVLNNKGWQYKFNDETLKNEVLSRGCDWNALEQENVYDWDGKRIDFQRMTIYKPTTYCSKNYLAVLYVPEDIIEEGESQRELKLSIFKRADLTPLQYGQASFLHQGDSNLAHNDLQGKFTMKEIEVGTDNNKQPFYKIRYNNTLYLEGQYTQTDVVDLVVDDDY